MLKRCALGMCSLVMLTTVCDAGIITALTTLSGPGENPPNASPGTGAATITIDTVLNTMRVQVSFSGLLGTTTASHIHCCIVPPGATGVATTVPTFPGFPLGVTSGTYDMTLDLMASGSYNPSFVTSFGGGTTAGAETALINGIEAGDAYLNVHSTVVPGGEIRGFLTVTPEPATMLLMTAGMGVMLLAWRRRRA